MYLAALCGVRGADGHRAAFRLAVMDDGADVSLSRIEQRTFLDFTYNLAIATDSCRAVTNVGADSGEIGRGEALHVRLDSSTCIALTPADQPGAAER